MSARMRAPRQRTEVKGWRLGDWCCWDGSGSKKATAHMRGLARVCDFGNFGTITIRILHLDEAGRYSWNYVNARASSLRREEPSDHDLYHWSMAELTA